MESRPNVNIETTMAKYRNLLTNEQSPTLDGDIKHVFSNWKSVPCLPGGYVTGGLKS